MFYMTLATILIGLLILVKGVGILAKGGKYLAMKKKMLYNRPLGVVVWTAAVAWTLWEVTKLGPADFGNFKTLLFGIFLALGVSSIWMLKDYLIVRAGSVLMLLISWWCLKAAYLQPQWTRLIFVTTVYAMIVAALYFAVAPWRARDILEALGKNAKLRKTVGRAYVILGGLLIVVGITYRWV